MSEWTVSLRLERRPRAITAADLSEPFDRFRSALAERRAWGPVLARLRVPVLLIYGETDRWVPIERSIDVWRSALTEADARLTVARIPGAGHIPTLVQDPTDLDEEGPVAPEYERVITGWLTEVTRLPSKGHG